MERVHTPEIRTIAELSEFLGISDHDTVKTMAGKTPEGRLVFLLVPGDRELNPIKAGNLVPGLELLEEADFKTFEIPKGSLGPVDVRSGTLVIADKSLEGDVAWGIGANENDYHYVNAQPGRDFSVDQWADIVLAQAGDRCPECGGAVQMARGIEVSQVFQLGTKYSTSMNATFTDEDGNEQPFIMGCYGVGVSRTLAAVIEQYNDDKGIQWPVGVAPLEVAVLPLMAEGEVAEVAENVFNELAAAGIETVIDDRDERAGVKFNDADLIGWPFQLVVGKKGLAEGVIELKTRASGERTTVPVADAVSHVRDLVIAQRARYAH